MSHLATPCRCSSVYVFFSSPDGPNVLSLLPMSSSLHPGGGGMWSAPAGVELPFFTMASINTAIMKTQAGLNIGVIGVKDRHK